jgi:UDP-N-acetylglucosamine--N-acetylmuramyl-(pentapeptide) pyrophosphoryl-undecaprenol N-acetylglucosamine transferase
MALCFTEPYQESQRTMKRVVFASGGSGGHLAPAIALAQRTIELGVRPWIVTTEKQVDKRMREAYGSFDFISWKGVAYDGSIVSLFLFALSFAKSLPHAFWFLHRNRIELVVTTGGFGSTPVILAALMMGIPVFAHESNSVPGKVTRLFASFFTQLYFTRLLWNPSRISKSSCITGFPLRTDLSQYETDEAKLKLGFEPNQKLITIFGGSQGSKRLTAFAETESRKLSEAGYQMLCVTGPGNYTPAVEAVAGIKYISFVEDMGALYCATDLLIARSGAGSIAEITSYNCPVVLVPLPGSADQHQAKNAEVFARSGAAIICEQDKLEDFGSDIVSIIENLDLLKKMVVSQQDWTLHNRMDDLLFNIVSETRGLLV